MIQILLALIQSLAGTIGGTTGSLVTQLVNTIGSVTLNKQEWDAFAGPWIVWANAIVDANRNATPDEHAAAQALAAAVHADNQALAAGQPGVALPLPPGA